MENKKAARFFLGSNSRSGFCSLYDELTDPAAGDFLWVIKGGPGCGKSSFMKKLGLAGEERGYEVEYIQCSGDPDSLDGVRFPELKTAYVDGTAPHVIEAEYPGCASLYLDLGTFYDAEALEASLDLVADITARYKALYASAYDCLAAAAALQKKRRDGIWGDAEKQKILKKLSGLASRELKTGAGASVKRRFLSSVGCKGRVLLEETPGAYCERLCTLDNELGMANFYLEQLAEIALERELSIIVCPDPLMPELIEAVLIPELSLGFLAVDKEKSYSGEVYRHIRLDALADKAVVSAARTRTRRAAKLQEELISCAVEELSAAKALHDELEAIYNPHVDFDGLYATANDHIFWLFENSCRIDPV